MAFTVTKTKATVMGDERVVHLKITADAATQNVETGLGYINGFAVGQCSLTTGSPKIYANSGAGGTSIGGMLGISGVASGDEMFITVFGR